MTTSKMWRALPVALLVIVAGCASRPETRGEQQALLQQASATVQQMVNRDPSLAQVLEQSAGYIVFPSVGEGGFIIGGAQGIGVVYERGRPIGTARLTQASIGALAGGQTFAELVVFRTPEALQRVQLGEFGIRADASVTALRAGTAAATRFDNDVAVFVEPEFGAMAEASVGGQRISFEPLV